MSTPALENLSERILAELQDRSVREEEYQQLELIESRRRTGA